MILHHKVFELKNKEGNKIDLEQIAKVGVLMNGVNNGSLVRDVFKKFEFEDHKIVGYSILEYFKLKDGRLEDEDGNTINFIDLTTKQEIFVLKVRDPWIILNDITVSTDYVKVVSKILQMKNIEKIVPDLTAEEKQEFNSEREKQEAEVTAKQKEQERIKAEQEAAEAKAKQEEQERIAAEEKRKAEQEAVEAERKRIEEQEMSDKERIEAEAKLKEEEERIKAEQEAAEAKAKQDEEERIKAEQEAAEAKLKAEQEEARLAEIKEAAEQKQRVLEEYEALKSFYTEEGYTEFELDDYRFLFKEGDIPYLVKVTDTDFDQLDIEETENKDGVMKYSFNDNGDKIFTFDKKEEEFAIDDVEVKEKV